MSFMKEFREFAMRGNVVDLAHPTPSEKLLTEIRDLLKSRA